MDTCISGGWLWGLLLTVNDRRLHAHTNTFMRPAQLTAILFPHYPPRLFACGGGIKMQVLKGKASKAPNRNH